MPEVSSPRFPRSGFQCGADMEYLRSGGAGTLRPWPNSPLPGIVTTAQGHSDVLLLGTTNSFWLLTPLPGPLANRAELWTPTAACSSPGISQESTAGPHPHGPQNSKRPPLPGPAPGQAQPQALTTTFLKPPGHPMPLPRQVQHPLLRGRSRAPAGSPADPSHSAEGLQLTSKARQCDATLGPSGKPTEKRLSKPPTGPGVRLGD